MGSLSEWGIFREDYSEEGAAWDLTFHTISLAMVDLDFAKGQLALMLQENYLHPNGQVPAYEWNFSDVNPPVHAWALNAIYQIEKEFRGQGDINFLKDMFQKLMLNFTWWVNRKDRNGHMPVFMERVHWLNQNRPNLVGTIPSLIEPGVKGRRLLAVLNGDKLCQILSRMLDEEEFLGSFGIRSISRYHQAHPYVVSVG